MKPDYMTCLHMNKNKNRYGSLTFDYYTSVKKAYSDRVPNFPPNQKYHHEREVMNQSDIKRNQVREAP